jgi:probable HAF family extracellular repeat protein
MTCIYQKLAGAAACTVLGLVASQSANAASLYSLTDLGSLTGKTFSYASSINNFGQVAVNSGFNDSRAFLYSDDQLIEIQPLPDDDALAVFDINNFGQVVGDSVNTSNFTGNHPFVYSNGTTQSFGISDGIPYGINDSGQIVGGAYGIGAFLYSNGTTSSLLPEGGGAYGLNNLGQVVGIFGSPSRAFLYDNGTITNLGTLPGHNYSSAEDINDLGQVVGVSAPSGVNDGTAFLYSSNTGMISLGRLFPTDAYSVAIGINNLGQVVGWSGTNPNFYSESGVGIRAFLYSDGVMQDLNNLIAPGSNFILTQAQGINDRGQIAGAGVINGELHAVLLTPQPSQGVPEPASTLGILAFGAIGAGSLLKRKL